MAYYEDGTLTRTDFYPRPHHMCGDEVDDGVSQHVFQVVTHGGPEKRLTSQHQQRQRPQNPRTHLTSRTFKGLIKYKIGEVPKPDDIIVANGVKGKQRACRFLRSLGRLSEVQVVGSRSGRLMADIKGTVLAKYFIVVIFWKPKRGRDGELDDQDVKDYKLELVNALQQHDIRVEDVDTLVCRVDSHFNPPNELPYSLLFKYEKVWIPNDAIQGKIGSLVGDTSALGRAGMTRQVFTDSLSKVRIPTTFFDNYLNNGCDERQLYTAERWARARLNLQERARFGGLPPSVGNVSNSTMSQYSASFAASPSTLNGSAQYSHMPFAPVNQWGAGSASNPTMRNTWSFPPPVTAAPTANLPTPQFLLAYATSMAASMSMFTTMLSQQFGLARPTLPAASATPTLPVASANLTLAAASATPTLAVASASPTLSVASAALPAAARDREHDCPPPWPKTSNQPPKEITNKRSRSDSLPEEPSVTPLPKKKKRPRGGKKNPNPRTRVQTMQTDARIPSDDDALKPHTDSAANGYEAQSEEHIEDTVSGISGGPTVKTAPPVGLEEVNASQNGDDQVLKVKDHSQADDEFAAPAAPTGPLAPLALDASEVSEALGVKRRKRYHTYNEVPAQRRADRQHTATSKEGHPEKQKLD